MDLSQGTISGSVGNDDIDDDASRLVFWLNSFNSGKCWMMNCCERGDGYVISTYYMEFLDGLGKFWRRVFLQIGVYFPLIAQWRIIVRVEEFTYNEKREFHLIFQLGCHCLMNIHIYVISAAGRRCERVRVKTFRWRGEFTAAAL
jgi:hypothetical protein